MALDPYRRLPKKYRGTFVGLRTSLPAAHRGAKKTMPNPFLAIVLLGLEANRVINLRVMKIAKGGEDARNEAFLMVDEKVLAAREACASLFAGQGPEVVINRYREHVAANAIRLAASSANVGTYRVNGILRWVSMLGRKIRT
jgi:hypothetical protein